MTIRLLWIAFVVLAIYTGVHEATYAIDPFNTVTYGDNWQFYPAAG
jgi:hypothetical protein